MMEDRLMDELLELRERLWLATVPLGGATDKYGLPWNDIFNKIIDLFAKKDGEIARLQERLKDNRKYFKSLYQQLAEKYTEIARLKDIISELDKKEMERNSR